MHLVQLYEVSVQTVSIYTARLLDDRVSSRIISCSFTIQSGYSWNCSGRSGYPSLDLSRSMLATEPETISSRANRQTRWPNALTVLMFNCSILLYFRVSYSQLLVSKARDPPHEHGPPRLRRHLEGDGESE